MAVRDTSSTIALISMPWSLFNRPSVQLGALKAYIENNSDIAVDCFHPYLSAAKHIGTDIYTYLSKNSWAGEAIYAAILFPERREQAARLFRRSCADNPEIAGKFDTIYNSLENQLNEWTRSTEFKGYRLLGFSVCFSQLFASLAAAVRIKEITPATPVVFGGSSCVGNMGDSMSRAFSQIDYVITGEGEKKLLNLCRALEKGNAQPSQTSVAAADGKTNAIADLNTLPTPDYHPYFNELEHVFPGKPFSPVLPIEFSRGCWWRHCTFCNLNLQWHGYRRKSAAKMSSEVKQLHDRLHSLDFTFCDNALPVSETDIFFSTIRKWDIDLHFFAEIRAIKDPQKLSLYRSGGLTTVQVGIESFSNSLLAKMNKGTTVIENLAVMKYCAENSITLDGNLIVEFPGSSEEEAAETLANLEYALPFHPLSAATFFLGSGSAIDINPSEFSIRAVTAHAHYNELFPAAIMEKMDLLIKDFRGDKSIQRMRWQPVREMIRKWQDVHKKRCKDSPLLSYRDGGSFLVIRQARSEEAPLLHRLRGKSRKIYLFCRVIRNLDEIARQFPELPRKTLLNFFDDLSKKQLLYQENKQFLALAIRSR